MEDILCKTEYNDLFEKFMLSMKDELYLKFDEFLKNNNLKTERNDEADIDQITSKKKGRGRPKKIIDDNQDDIINKPKKRGRGRPKKDSIDVVRIEREGSIYLRDGTNKLYNMSDQEYVGVYDEVNGTIVLD